MKIKNYIWLILVIGFTGTQAAAQRVPSKPAQRQSAHRAPAPAQGGLTAAEIANALDTSIATTCSATAPSAPRALSHNAQVFSANRVASTINGVWLGKVSGEYDPQLFAKDGFLNVDYYMIIDISRGEAFVYQEFTDRRSGAAFTPQPGAATWAYTWCAKENYQSPSPRQVHSFTKVSDDVNDARDILANSVGVNVTGDVVLSEVWQKLVDAKFFDDPNRSLAYAGVLFNPVTMGNVQTAGGGSLFELRMVGEYRGIGETAAKFVPGEPIFNVERGHFLGLSAGSGTTTASSSRGRARAPRALVATAESEGDYLVASTELGNEMEGAKSDAQVAVFSTQMPFDKVVIGPLSLKAFGTVTPAAAAKVAPSDKAPAGTKQRKAHSAKQRKAHR
jgi:hypothetical protein